MIAQMFTLQKGLEEYRYKFAVNVQPFGFGSPEAHTFIMGYKNDRI